MTSQTGAARARDHLESMLADAGLSQDDIPTALKLADRYASRSAAEEKAHTVTALINVDADPTPEQVDRIRSIFHEAREEVVAAERARILAVLIYNECADEVPDWVLEVVRDERIK